MNESELDNMSFYQLCKAAGFTKNGNRYDKARLADFYGKSERTIERMLKAGSFHDMNIRLLKLQVLNVNLQHQIDILVSEPDKFHHVNEIVIRLNKDKILKHIRYPIIKKVVLKYLCILISNS